MTQKIPTNNLKFSYSLDPFNFNNDCPYLIFECGLSNDSITDLHKHNFFEIGICKKGTGLFLIGNKIYTFKPGDIFLIGQNYYHRAHSNDSKEDLWAFCYINFENWVGESVLSNFQMITNKLNDTKLYSMVNILFDEYKNKENQYDTILDGLIIAIYYSIKRKSENNDKLNLSISLPPSLDIRINRAINLMINNNFLSKSIQEIAHECNLSTSHFRQLFKSQIGCSPKDYQIQIRIKKAMSILLNNDDKIINIAYECGFESLTSFNRKFKEKIGITPLKWKEEMKK